MKTSFLISKMDYFGTLGISTTVRYALITRPRILQFRSNAHAKRKDSSSMILRRHSRNTSTTVQIKEGHSQQVLMVDIMGLVLYNKNTCLISFTQAWKIKLMKNRKL
jgi:hypothetical protein